MCSEVVRWLAQRAEELGVEIYPGFAAAEALYARRGGPAGTVVGIATGDMGIGERAREQYHWVRMHAAWPAWQPADCDAQEVPGGLGWAVCVCGRSTARGHS